MLQLHVSLSLSFSSSFSSSTWLCKQVRILWPMHRFDENEQTSVKYIQNNLVLIHLKISTLISLLRIIYPPIKLKKNKSHVNARRQKLCSYIKRYIRFWFVCQWIKDILVTENIDASTTQMFQFPIVEYRLILSKEIFFVLYSIAEEISITEICWNISLIFTFQFLIIDFCTISTLFSIGLE